MPCGSRLCNDYSMNTPHNANKNKTWCFLLPMPSINLLHLFLSSSSPLSSFPSNADLGRAETQLPLYSGPNPNGRCLQSSHLPVTCLPVWQLLEQTPSSHNWSCLTSRVPTFSRDKSAAQLRTILQRSRSQSSAATFVEYSGWMFMYTCK